MRQAERSPDLREVGPPPASSSALESQSLRSPDRWLAMPMAASSDVARLSRRAAMEARKTAWRRACRVGSPPLTMFRRRVEAWGSPAGPRRGVVVAAPAPAPTPPHPLPKLTADDWCTGDASGPAPCALPQLSPPPPPRLRWGGDLGPPLAPDSMGDAAGCATASSAARNDSRGSVTSPLGPCNAAVRQENRDCVCDSGACVGRALPGGTASA